MGWTMEVDSAIVVYVTDEPLYVATCTPCLLLPDRCPKNTTWVSELMLGLPDWGPNVVVGSTLNAWLAATGTDGPDGPRCWRIVAGLVPICRQYGTSPRSLTATNAGLA